MLARILDEYIDHRWWASLFDALAQSSRIKILDYLEWRKSIGLEQTKDPLRIKELVVPFAQLPTSTPIAPASQAKPQAAKISGRNMFSYSTYLPHSYLNSLYGQVFIM